MAQVVNIAFVVIKVALLVEGKAVQKRMWTLDYCKFQCGPSEHTMCEFKRPNDSRACYNFVEAPLSADDKQTILRLHNEYRSYVASGLKVGQPRASNMQQMFWDAELAMIAKNWAEQCLIGHDTCRKVDRFSVGQNIGINYHHDILSANLLRDFMKAACDDWYDEIRFFDPTNELEQITKVHGIYEHSTGHYTQLVWATTRRVGCGRATFMLKGKWAVMLVCNYGPMGNIRNSPVYEQGAPCTHCLPSYECSYKYPGLCIKNTRNMISDADKYHMSSQVYIFSVIMIFCMVHRCVD